MDHPFLSVVVPVFNEQESLPELHRQLAAATTEPISSWEVIYVDDGSEDNTWEVMRALCKQDRHVIAIRLRRNFGQTAAMAAGIDRACGDVIITLDADLQNDPRDIPALVAKLDEG